MQTVSGVLYMLLGFKNAQIANFKSWYFEIANF